MRIRTISVNLGILAVGVIVLELVFGNWLITDNLNQLMLIRNSDWVFRIENNHPYTHPEKYIYYSRDENGLRGESFSKASEVKILTIGGSTTDQRYISEGETWQDVMANKFNEEGFSFPVANAGIDGHSTYGHLLALQTWINIIEGLRPDFFLFYVGINDLFRLEPNEYDLGLGYYHDDGLHFVRRFMQKSALYHVFRVINGSLAIKSKKAGHSKVNFSELNWKEQVWDEQRIMKTKQIYGSYLLDYSSRLEALCALTQDHATTPVFVTQSSAKGLNRGKTFEYSAGWGDDSVYRLRALNDVTMESCRRCVRAICLDLAAELFLTADDYYDAAHNTPKGAKKIGTFLTEKLLPYIDASQRDSRYD